MSLLIIILQLSPSIIRILLILKESTKDSLLTLLEDLLLLLVQLPQLCRRSIHLSTRLVILTVGDKVAITKITVMIPLSMRV